jgi:hypothetical protein
MGGQQATAPGRVQINRCGRESCERAGGRGGWWKWAGRIVVPGRRRRYRAGCRRARGPLPCDRRFPRPPGLRAGATGAPSAMPARDAWGRGDPCAERAHGRRAHSGRGRGQVPPRPMSRMPSAIDCAMSHMPYARCHMPCTAAPGPAGRPVRPAAAALLAANRRGGSCLPQTLVPAGLQCGG